MIEIGCCTTMADYVVLKDLGFDYIELSGKWLAALSDQMFNEYITVIQNGDLPCYALNAYCGPEIVIAGVGYNTDVIESYAHHLGKRAKVLGVRHINIGSPKSRTIDYRTSIDTANNQMTQFFDLTSRIMAGYDIVVCVEALGPCYCNVLNHTFEATDLVEALNRPNLKVVLDLYNMDHVGEDICDLEINMDLVAHVHLSEDAGSPKERYFLRPVNYQRHNKRIHALVEKGYRGNISIEIDLPVNTNLAKQNLELIRNAINEKGACYGKN